MAPSSKVLQFVVRTCQNRGFIDALMMFLGFSGPYFGSLVSPGPASGFLTHQTRHDVTEMLKVTHSMLFGKLIVNLFILFVKT